MANTPIPRQKETWFVTNVTLNSLTISDVPSIPVIKAGQRIDLLVYARLEIVQASTVIAGYISNGNLSSEEYLHTHEDKADTIHTHILTDVTDVNATADELNQLTGGNDAGDLHTHKHNELDGLNEDDFIHLTADGRIDFITLTDGSNADDLHTHGVSATPDHNDLGGLNVEDYQHLTSSEKTDFGLNTTHRHDESHTIVSHDTTATGSNLNTLTNSVDADSLHTHSHANLVSVVANEHIDWTSATESLLTTGDISIDSNSSKLYLGDNQDSSIYFDGTDLNITLNDPSQTGKINLTDSINISGQLTVTDDVFITGDNHLDLSGITRITEFDPVVCYSDLVGWGKWLSGGGAGPDVCNGIAYRSTGSHIHTRMGNVAGATVTAFGIAAEDYPRIKIAADGTLRFGLKNGSGNLDPVVTLYSDTAGELKTDDDFDCQNISCQIITTNDNNINMGVGTLSGDNVNITSTLSANRVATSEFVFPAYLGIVINDTSSQTTSAQNIFDKDFYGGTLNLDPTQVTPVGITFTDTDGKFVIDSGYDGIYEISLGVILYQVTVETVDIIIKLNGSEIYNHPVIVHPSVSPNSYPVSLLIDLEPAGYLEFWVDGVNGTSVREGTSLTIKRIATV